MTFESRFYTVYKQFVRALAYGDIETARACVDLDNFTADLSKGKLDFEAFIAEFERQRVAFPDLGKYISDMHWSEEANKARAVYEMTTTFSGRLTNDKGYYLEPTGKKVVISSIDYITFGPNDKIVGLTIRVVERMIVEQIVPEDN